MPGPGGGGPGGFGGGGPGGFGGGGPGGFGGGGPGGFGGPGGPGFFGGPGGPGWGGPWFGPGLGCPLFLAGPEFGPCGLPWFWWPILVLVIPFVLFVSVGIVLIQTFEGCDQDSEGDQTSESACVGYEALYAAVLAIVMICLFCCCFVGCKERESGTTAERSHMLATEAPPPAMVYAQEASAPPQQMKTATAVPVDSEKYS